MIDTETRWQQARWLLHDDSLKPEDRLAGLLVLLYAQRTTTISRLTLSHVQAADGQVLIRLGREPVVLPGPSTCSRPQVAATRRGHAALGDDGTSAWLFPGGRPGQPISAYRLGERLSEIGIRAASPGRPRCSSSPPTCPPRSWPACSASTSASQSLAAGLRRRLDRLRRRR